MAFTPDGAGLAIAYASPIYENNAVDMWSTVSWIITYTLQTGPALEVSFSPDSSLMAVTPHRYAIRIFDFSEFQWLGKLETSFTGAVTKMDFSPNQPVLASGHYDGAIRFWNAQTGEQILLIQSEEVIESIAYSPDGRMIATGGSFQNQLVRLWDAQSGALLRTLEGHTSGVNSLEFSPDSQFLASASYDGTVILWGIRP
jgi:WD40 repeat protein